MTNSSAPLDVLIIGAGQAGLALGHHLRRAGLNFLLTDAAPRVGHSWRSRYDSLVLFTPAKRDALPGLPFPGHPEHYPTKDEVADYLEEYVRTFGLPLELGTRVTRVGQVPGGFAVTTDRGVRHAHAVVVATGPFQTPFVPPVAGGLLSEVVQLHSSAYRNPAGLPQGHVLIVGSGNSGAQIAEELTRTHQVTLALGKWQPALPQRVLGRDLFDVLEPLGFFEVSASSPLGRVLRRRDPVIGTNVRRLARAGQLRVVPRVVGAQGRTVQTADGQQHEVDAVVWATGYRPDYGWLEVDVLDAGGRPLHDGGVTRVPGLYFLGLSWQRTRASALLGGVGQDAEAVAAHIARHLSSERLEAARGRTSAVT